MLKSMTGFGRAEAADENFHLSIEIRAVNQRFLDLTFRMPRGLFAYEEEITRRIKEKLTRGKIEIFVNLQDFRENTSSFSIDVPLAKAYKNALDEMSDKLNLPQNTSVVQIASYPGVLTYDESNLDGIEDVLYNALENALETLNSMRIREGSRIEKDFLVRMDTLETFVDTAESLEDTIVSAYRERIKSAVKEALSGVVFDEGRLLQEVAIYSDRVNYTEEVVRLKSHLHQFKKMLAEEGARGRKLDFLIQEMNREANTIGSKANNKDVAQLVVDMKAEIEKLREQVQNIE